VKRIPGEIAVRKVFTNISEGKKNHCKVKKEIVGHVQNDLKKMNVRGWRK